MGVFHSRASKKRDKAEAELLKAQKKQVRKDTGNQWDQILASIESGEVSWDDLSRLQKLSMPVAYQIRCKAAERRRS